MRLDIRTIWASGGTALLVALALPGATSSPKRAKTVAAKAPLSGAQVFGQMCARCHGANGGGSATYPRALIGSQTVAQLTRYITESMPPGPKQCPAAASPKVAAYIYDAFYSPIAQERNRPARVALSRLTVPQLRNTLTDLIGSFRGPAPAATDHGLSAEYFKAKRFSGEDRILQRVDPQVQFDFGPNAPEGDTFDPHQFSIRWSGSVVAPDTGEYEFVLHSEHAVRLWVNDLQKPLIDASVRSSNTTEFRETLYLIGGRSYPLRLEFSKSTQGVDDTAKQKTKPSAPASVALSWKRPHQSDEPIPTRCLLPASGPEAFVLTTPFPPDDRSLGYERGNSISKDWDDATTAAALETAAYVGRHLGELAGASDDPLRLRAFCRKFVERALRRPLDDATTKLYIDRQFERSPDVQTAVKRVVLLTVTSPQFLYREITGGAADPYNIASRLSYTLWDSSPDDTLLRAAASGALATHDQIAAQAERMVADPRAWAKQRAFFLQWLKVDQYPDLAKDPKRYPDFTPAVATDLRTSLDLTLEGIVRNGSSDFRDLLQSDKVYLNGRLAKLYGASLAPDAPFQPVSLDSGVRAGVLTHPYILASLAYFAGSDPIHRGVLLTRNVMGRTLLPPPAAFPPLSADLHPNLTTRQRVMLQTRPATCQACHGIINPLGFTMERFDAIGRLRTTDSGQIIDSTGGYVPQAGKPTHFSGARDLAAYIAGSDEAHAAFVKRLFQYFVKQPIRAYGPKELPSLEHGFADQGYNIRQLAVTIATEAALPRTGQE
jgi:mono/diheme cytochrome c family protein